MHTVKKGETVYSISRLYGVTEQSLTETNSIVGNQIKVGQSLYIPSAQPKSNILTISDFCISPEPIPVHIADAIYLHHLIPLNNVNKKVGAWVSLKSCYRPISYELSKKRTGESLHTFKDGKGACDIAADNLDELLKVLIRETKYMRFAVYPTFIHCDYASNERQLFTSDSNSNWTFKQNL